MVAVPAMLTVLKYGFLGLVVTGAGFLIANTIVVTRQQEEALKELLYRSMPVTKNVSTFDKNSLRCLTHPRRPFCLLSSNSRLELVRNRHLGMPIHQVKENSIHPIYSFLLHFKDLMSTLNVKNVLLEPSILFCMLIPLLKYELISSGLQTNILRGPSNVLSFGVFEEDAVVLNHEAAIKMFVKSGYKFSRAQKWIEMEGTGDFYSTHFFYTKENVTAHVIVFYKRDNFLWYPGLSKADFPIEVEPFGRNCIFENFNAFPLSFENGINSGFYVPSQTDSFVFQIQSSQFKNCSPLPNFEEKNSYEMTAEQLNQRARIAIQELKLRLNKKLGNFWLWKETLRGWRQSCNLFHESPEFNLALQASVISSMNLTIDDEYLQLLEYQQWEDINHKIILNCYGLKINLFPIYEDGPSVWYYERNDTKNLVKMTYSKFQLCSTSVLGQLLHLPCDDTLEQKLNTL